MASQSEIAARLGVNQSTVSRALRDDPLIPEATRETVRKTALELDYHPNPLVSALMEHIRSGAPVKDLGCLAILVDASDEADWMQHPAYRQQYDAICRRAALRGYRAEPFYLRAPGMNPQRIDRILQARGIVGVILAAPRRQESPPIKLAWEKYALVTAGYTWQAPLVDRVSTHYRRHVELAFQQLQTRGYQRIGVCLPRPAISRTDSNLLAGYLVCQDRLPRTQRIPVFYGQIEVTPLENFKQWFNRWKPDAILCLNGGEISWLTEMGLSVGTDLGLACLCHIPGSNLSAVDENNGVIGEILCDLVSAHLVHNTRGIPSHPRLTLIEGTWVEGSTYLERHV